MHVQTSFIYALGLALSLLGSFVSSRAPPMPVNFSSYPLTVIHEFPNPTWLENIAVRYNGELLVTSLTSPSLYQVDPHQTRQPLLVAEIPDSIGLLGIAELEKDVFYVIAGKSSNSAFSFSFRSSIWKVDFREFCLEEDGTVSRPAKLSLVADMPDTQFLNGMCRLAPNDNSALLIADSIAGSVIRLDVNTGSYNTVIKDKTMASPSPAGALGINGIRVHGQDLFFTNFAEKTFMKMPISRVRGTAAGPAAVVINGTTGDDFILSKDGKKAWIATNFLNTLFEVHTPGQKGRIVAGGANGTDLVRATAVAFGRTWGDRNSLYVVTTGGLDSPFGGRGVTGGRVVRVDLPENYF